jgi:phosphotriesterase-related protein
MGPTLVHEHIRICYPGDDLDPNNTWDRKKNVDVGVERMARLADHRVRTIVDPCPIDLARDPELMAEVARQSGMQVICSTGFYHEDIGIPYYWRVRSSEEIAELYLYEIEHGIGDTGIRPGCIKIASFDPVGEYDRKVIRGAALAAAEANVTVISHCENSNGGDVQQEILVGEGVDLGRCLIGHQDQATDPKQLVALAERGSFVGVDRVGYDVLAPDERRVELVMAMVEAGRGDQLCLSQDHMGCLCSPRMPFRIPAEMADVADSLLAGLNEHLHERRDFLFTGLKPELEKAGIDDGTFQSILTDNPRRLFGG